MALSQRDREVIESFLRRLSEAATGQYPGRTPTATEIVARLQNKRETHRPERTPEVLPPTDEFDLWLAEGK